MTATTTRAADIARALGVPPDHLKRFLADRPDLAGLADRRPDGPSWGKAAAAKVVAAFLRARGEA